MSQAMMRAARAHQYGGPEQLQVEQLPRPEPRAGEILVRLRAVGVLPIEWKIRQGLFQKFQPNALPYLPGSAFAGVVEQLGAGVSEFEVGQAVFGRSANGAYAEYTTAAAATTAPMPSGLGFAEAATISGSATVAWAALFENGGLQPGQRILIHAAAGGVGMFAVQFARLHGAHVIGTASADNLAFVRELGAETAIDYAATPFEQLAHDVDMVLDTVGGETLRRSLATLRPGGILVSLLEDPPQDLAEARGVRATKNSVTQPFPARSLLETIARQIADGQVRTLVQARFPLDEAWRAQELSQRGHGRGRIVIEIG